ncbi:MAG: hypothetical protein AAB660_00590 [Patescibacteria group bacterium]
MEFFHKNQKAILAIVLLGTAFYVYMTFFKSDSAPTPEDQTAQQVGGEVLALYQSLQTVSLDQTLFSYSLYKKLVDFSIAIPSQTPGRVNPFNVIGQD